MQAAGKRYLVHGSRTDEFTIYNFACVHWLNASCAEKRFLADVEQVRQDPHALWLSGGDLGEFIGYQDLRRFDPQCVSRRVNVADLGRLGKKTYQELRDIFHPIRDKCLGLHIGNHEYKYMLRLEQHDLHGWLCSELGAPNLGYSSLMDLICVRNPKAKRPRLTTDAQDVGCTRQAFRIFSHHGAGWAQTKGGKINRLTKFMQDFEADIYFVSHVHERTGIRIVTVGADEKCERLVEREKVGVISGSYLLTYAENQTGYGERAGYSPTTLGAAWVRIKPETREIWGRI